MPSSPAPACRSRSAPTEPSTFTPPTEDGAFTFSYRLANAAGYSDGTATITIDPAEPQPDLEWVSCTVSPLNPVVGDRVDFDLVLANNGDADAVFPDGYNFGIRMTGGAGSVAGTGLSTSGIVIAPGETRSMPLYWPEASAAAGTYTPSVVADPQNRVIESNEDNNTISCGTVTIAEST